MEDTLKHLRAVHFLLVLTACATTYFSFAENSGSKKLVSNLIRFMNEGTNTHSTFQEVGFERFSAFPAIQQNFFRLSYRKLDEIPEIVADIERSEGSQPSILGIQLVGTHILTAGSLVQLFILLYLYVVLINIRTVLEGGCDLTLPVPWIGAMQHWLARALVWSTVFLVPSASSTLAFLYFPSFLGIVSVSLPIAIVGAAAARESGRLTTAIHEKSNRNAGKAA